MLHIKRFRCFFTLLLLVVVAACGGGSSGNSNNNDDNKSSDDINTGHFTYSAVAGLTYTTATQSGITDSTGKFTYKDGETITFSLGGIVIGEMVTAKIEMTPFDLVPGATLYTNNTQLEKLFRASIVGSTAAEYVAFNKFSNILVFLQSLDDDANPDNGINIPAGIAPLLNDVQLDFESDFSEFSNKFSNTALRIVTHQAADQGLISTGAIREAGYALDHFYRVQGINHSFTVPGVAKP